MGFAREMANELMKTSMLTHAGKSILQEIKKKELDIIFCSDCGKKIPKNKISSQCNKCKSILCKNCRYIHNNKVYCKDCRGVLRGFVDFMNSM